MDKENGENTEGGSNSNKLSNPTDPSALLDAASLFAYWPRGDTANTANAANLFAAAGGAYGLGGHPSIPFGLLPPASGRGVSPYPSSTTAAAAAYSNAYTNTLSVAASQAASLGIPAASAAWWSMASHLAAQDYIARLQASGLNFPSLSNPADLPYSSLGLSSLSGYHKSSKNSKNSSASSSSSSSLPKSQQGNSSKNKNATGSSSHNLKSDGRLLDQSSIRTSSPLSYSKTSTSSTNASKFSSNSSSLTIQPSMKLPSTSSSTSSNNGDRKTPKINDLNYMKPVDKPKISSPKVSSQTASSIFTNPLSLASNLEKNNVSTTTSVNSSISSSLPSSILSAALEGNNDPGTILGGVRLPPDTEIIKYTSSIVGPKIPGTTNRGRKKTISLDPPSVSVHPSLSGGASMHIERPMKRSKLSDQQELSNTLNATSDRVEVIKLASTNGSPSISVPSYSNSASYFETSNDAPLNLSMKPTTTSTTNLTSSSLNSLSNMSANLGVDRISRRKPGPKPRKVVQSSHLPPGAPSASLQQLFASADSPRPPSRSDDGIMGVSTAMTTSTTSTISSLPVPIHKDGRPRNLGRGISKPKKNTVASLLAQSRALGIKPMPILDPNTSMNQQISLLKSNILAAQQLMVEAGGDEKTFNKLLQERFRGALSDSNSSTVDASTDSDNLTDSNHTDSEMEAENSVAVKKQKQFDEHALRVPLEKGWKRETIIRGLGKNGNIKGDVTYVAPDSSNKFKQMSDITQYLDYQKSTEFTKDNFTFSSRVILGDYLQPVPSGMATESGEFIRLTEDDVGRRLDELKSATRTSLAVEQRIEVARRQQAARAQARMEKEQARLQREMERSERQEAARREREARSQQLLEGRKRLAFTLEQKIQIISEIEGGKTKSDVSRELGLASSTVATIWKNRDNIISAYGSENFTTQDYNRDSSKISELELLKSKCLSLTEGANIRTDSIMAKRKRQEEMEKHRQEEQHRKQQERELKRQQAAILKEQMYIQEISKQREMLYTVELERERRRQHMALIKALESRRKLEERERKKQQLLAEKQASKEKKLEQRRVEMEILTELRKPCEDLELAQKPLPEYDRIPGLKLPGKAFADILMVFEFLHNFGETLGFDMESLPTLDSLQQALMYNDTSSEAEEELLSVMTHLLVCAIEDPGIPNPARHTTSLGQTLRQADITHANLSEILRIYLYANATGEVKALTGVHFEREREKRVADHHQNGCEMLQTMQGGKNVTYYELLHENPTWKMSDMLKDKPFLALSPTDKAAMLAFLCNELLQNKAVIRQIEGSLDSVAQLKKERWILDAKIRKLRMLHSRKVRSEAVEKAQAKPDGETGGEAAVDSPALHKDDLLDDDENEMSENESVGTQPEEEEDNKLSGEELGKKLEKLVKQSETQLQSLNSATHQLRANCFGQDRYWRRYWSLPKAGGIFVEALESADPEELAEQGMMESDDDGNTPEIKSVDDIKNIINEVDDNVQDPTVDKEVRSIVGVKDESELDDSDKYSNINKSEHRKTPNRLDIMENGDVNDPCERSLDELRKSVEKIVQSLDRNNDFNQSTRNNHNIESHNNDEDAPSYNLGVNHVGGDDEHEKLNHVDEIKTRIEIGDEEQTFMKKLNIFEKLGECMERENRTEEELKTEVKAEVKEELKNEILNELKTEIKIEMKAEIKHDSEDDRIEPEIKWFSILSKDGTTCEGPHLTQGNRWDNGVGVCSRENITELKIPVFPPPNSSSGYMSNTCDSPGPLQMTAEESVQLEYIKKHGLPKPCKRKVIPLEKRYGWWRIMDTEQLRTILENLHVRGARERELKRTFLSTMQSMYERQGKLYIEEGQKDATELNAAGYENIPMGEGGAPLSDEPCAWSQIVAHRVDMFLFEQLEALEDKVANASMQVKGWRIPNREGPEIPTGQIVPAAKERLASLEAAIERRYLKPPLGISTGDPNLAAIAQEAAGGSAPTQPIPTLDEIPKGLAVWREAVNRAQTSAQLAMCLYTLEASIAWDKSIMKANCQFCHNGDNEDKLLLCDGCDKGYHTYCFKPKMENIPEGDWYCHECMNKATGERNCIVCGKKQSTMSTRLLLCELCPRAYHTDCMRPVLNKAPRGKWYCSNCISKKPQKRTVRKNNTPKATTKDSESSSDHPPASPAPSHSSATTNEDQMQTNDLNNLSNAGSPSTQVNRKEKISKKLLKELAPCKAILEDLECHDDAWPFLLPVNTKQFPTYKKIIKNPMDLSSIKKRLQEVQYKSKEEFCADVRQIFNNCETFNEDDSPVGKAGHCMRQFFESRWTELCLSHS